MRFLILVSLLALAACDTAPKQPSVPDVPVVAPKTEVVIPAGLTAACPPLQPLTQASYSQGDSLDALKGWFNQYDLCSKRFSKFVGIVAPALNIKELGTQNPDVGSK